MAVTERPKSRGSARKQALRKTGPRTAPKTSCEKKELEGLCMNCANAGTCMFAAKAECPVIECEEFHCEGDCSQEKKTLRAPSAAEASSSGAPKEVEGLCANCDNHGTCTYAKPPGGVWHCQEYR